MDHWAGVLTLLTLSLVPCPATSEPVMLLHHQTQAETGFFGTCCEAHRSHFEPICCRTGKFGYFRRICCYSDCQFLSNLLVSANLIFRYYNCLSWILKWGEVLTTEWRVEKVSSRLIDKKVLLFLVNTDCSILMVLFGPKYHVMIVAGAVTVIALCD